MFHRLVSFIRRGLFSVRARFHHGLAPALAALLVAAIPVLLALAAPAGAVASEGCGGNDGATMLRAYHGGTFPIAPWDALPGADWIPYQHPGLAISLAYPPDWMAQELERTMPDRAGVRVAAAAGDAAFEVGAGIYVPVGTTASQAATLGIESLLGPRPDATILCADESRIEGTIDTLGALVVVQSGSNVVAVQAVVMTAPGSAQSYVVYYAMGGPAERFTALTEAVFLPILYLFIRTDYYDAVETPTPTP